jgi:hypothetical protein
VSESCALDLASAGGPAFDDGESFTITVNGETTAAIVMDDNDVNDATLMTRDHRLQNRMKIEEAVEALSTVGAGNVVVYVQDLVDYDEYFSGFARSGDAGVSCTDGVPGTATALTIDGSVTQGADAGVGVTVKCGATMTLDQGSNQGLTFTLGADGLVAEYGSLVTAQGSLVEVYKASPGFATELGAADTVWSIDTVVECRNGDCSSDPNMRRFTFPNEDYSDAQGLEAALPTAAPFIDAAIPNIDTTHGIVFFYPGSNSRDEGFMYWINDANSVDSPPWIEIDIRQSKYDGQDGYDDRKFVQQATLGAATAVGDVEITLDGTGPPASPIADNHEYVGHWIKLGTRWYLIAKTVDGTGAIDDTVTLVRNDGVREVIANGTTVDIAPNVHETGDRFVVVNAYWFTSATASQTDTPIDFYGESATGLDFVVFDDVQDLTFHGLTGTVGHVWMIDGGGSGGADTHRFTIGANRGSIFEFLQGTGGKEDFPDPNIDSGFHGVQILGARKGITFETLVQRHTGDDCIWTNKSWGTRPDSLRMLAKIGLMRCEQTTDVAHSSGAIDSAQHMDTKFRVGDLGCTNCDSQNHDTASKRDNFCNSGTTKVFTLDAGSLFSIGASPPGECAHYARNMYVAWPLHTKTPAAVEGDYINAMIEHVHGLATVLGSANCTGYLLQLQGDSTPDLGQNMEWKNTVIRDWTTTGAVQGYELAVCGLDWNNVMVLDWYRVGGTLQRMFQFKCNSDPNAPATYSMDKVTWYWSDPNGVGGDSDDYWGELMRFFICDEETAWRNTQYMNGLTFINNLNTEIFEDTATPPYASDPNNRFTWGPDGPFFYGIDDVAGAAEIDDLPSTTVFGQGPGFQSVEWGTTDNISLRPADNFAPTPQAMQRDVDSQVNKAGVCTLQKGHRWYDIPLEQTCVTTPGSGGGGGGSVGPRPY